MLYDTRKMEGYIKILLTFGTICAVYGYNVATKPSLIRVLTSPNSGLKSGALNKVGTSTLANGKSTLYGWEFVIHKPKNSKNTNVVIGSPKSPAPKTITNGNDLPGGVYSCTVPPGMRAESTCNMKKNLTGVGAGSSLGFLPNSPAVICSPAKTLKCTNMTYAPGFCYRSTDQNRESWTTPKSQQPKCPIDGVDLIFVLDGSASIQDVNFKIVKRWVVNISKGFDLSKGDIRVGVIQYSHWYKGLAIHKQNYIITEIKLGEYNENAAFQNKVNAIKLHKYTTYTGHALEKTEYDFKQSGRPDSKKVMILLTDGKSNDKEFVKPNADKLREMGVLTFAVGVGASINKTELQIIASGNTSSNERYFKVDDFNALEKIGTELKVTIKKLLLEGSTNSSLSSFEMENAAKGFSIRQGRNYKGVSNGALYLGAVGAYDWSGCVIKYDSVDDDTADIPKYVDVQSVLPDKTKASYLGYSVTSGYFQGGDVEYVASGAPRYKLKGAVVVYRPQRDSAKFVGSQTIYGPAALRKDMHGSYFGASLLSMDINNDGVHDLLVGAPLYIGLSHDEGRVFVYMGQQTNSISKWASDTFEPIQLTGTDLAGGRFGTAMANAGDMNGDKYNDVIVGAPLANEGGGAVYLYHGASTGINPKVKQVILASDIQGMKLQYFGQSLQGGVDLDQNQYPDIAVGAPKSDVVLIFRTKPVVKIEATTVSFSPKELKILQCFQKANRGCITLTVCFKASGKNIENEIGISYDISLDSGLSASAKKRIEFRTNENDTSGVETKTLTTTLISNSDPTPNSGCQTFQVYLKKNVFDYDTPLKATVKFDLLSAHTAKPMSSIRDPHEISSVEDTATFTKDCGQDGCQYNLGITGNLTIPEFTMGVNGTDTNLSEGGTVLVVAPQTVKSDIVLVGNLSNTGENAFDTILRMNISSYIGVTKFQTTGGSQPGKDSCLIEDPLLSKVIGDIKTVVYRYNYDEAYGSIMQKDNWCSFSITMHVAKAAIDSGDFSDFSVTLEAKTRDTSKTSQEIDATNNIFSEVRAMKYRSDLDVKKLSDEADVPFNFTEEVVTISSVKQIGNNTPDVEMRFAVNGLGYAAIPQTDMKLTYPLKSSTGNRILYLSELTCESPGKSTCTCDMSNVNIYNLTLDLPSANITNETTTYDVYPTTTSVDQSVFDCTNGSSDTCGTISCSVFNLAALDKVTLFAKFRFWTQDIRFNGTNITGIETRSLFSLTTENSKHLITSDGSAVATISQQIVITAKKYFPPEVVTKKDNLWIYILAAIGGLLLLIALVLILYKLGFFKSKYAEMKKDAQGMEDDFDMANGDNASTADIIS